MGRAKDRTEYASIAGRFHEQVVELAGNRTLALVGLILMEIVVRHNQATFAAIDDGDAVVKHAQSDHQKVLNALARGDGNEAARLWERHVRSAMDTAIAALGEDTRIGLLERVD